jgi:predicted metal-dependent phosphoesterase TrpH
VIDLHTHSTASDGTDAPGELIRKAAEQGLSAVAITDHDTTAGWDEAAQAAQQSGIALVRGAELSCDVGEAHVHMLAYLYDPQATTLLAMLASIRQARLTRLMVMTQNIAADYPVTWQDVQAHTEPGATVGRPHIADALISAGVVRDRGQAFSTMLSPSAPYYVPYYAPSAQDMIAAVVGAGGVPVIAHAFARKRGKIVSAEDIAALAEAGMLGIEVNHRDNAPEDRALLQGLADDLGLFVTGSSDYHGHGKPNRLAEFTTTPEVLEQIEAAGRLPVLR